MASNQFPPSGPPKLPPSTEHAYHGKCIDLKRRITEIEDENDKSILRKQRHTEGLQRNRLNRAILLKWLETLMDGGPGPNPAEMAALQADNANLGSVGNLNGTGRQYRLENDTEGSEDDNLPRPPPERPLRSKRSHNPVTSSTPAIATPQAITNPSATPLPALLIANSESPAAQEQMTSSFRVQAPPIVPTGSTPPFSASPAQPYTYTYTASSTLGPPVRPPAPFDLFCEEQRRPGQAGTLEEQRDPSVRSTWNGMTPEQQAPYHQLYGERMKKYEIEMDEYKRTRRDQQGGGGFKAVNAREEGIKQEN